MLSRSERNNGSFKGIISYNLPACSSAFCGGYLGSGVSSHYAGPVTPFQEGQARGETQTGLWCRCCQAAVHWVYSLSIGID